MLVLLGSDLLDEKFQGKLNKIIRKAQPRVVLHELLFDDSVTTSSKARNRLLEADEGAECDPRVNKKLYQLISKMVGYTKFYGVLPPYKKHTNNPMEFLSSTKYFNLKERFMTPEIIKQTKKASYSKLVVCIVDDKHLRNDADGDRYSQKAGWSFLIRRLTSAKIPFTIYRQDFIDGENENDFANLIKYLDVGRYL